MEVLWFPISLANGCAIPDAQRQGISLLPWIREPGAAATRSMIYSESIGAIGPPPYTNHAQAIRDERYKLIVAKGGFEPVEMLFDLDASPYGDGPPRYPGDPHTEEQAEARARLLAGMKQLEESTPFGAL